MSMGPYLPQCHVGRLRAFHRLGQHASSSINRAYWFPVLIANSHRGMARLSWYGWLVSTNINFQHWELNLDHGTVTNPSIKRSRICSLNQNSESQNSSRYNKKQITKITVDTRLKCIEKQQTKTELYNCIYIFIITAQCVLLYIIALLRQTMQSTLPITYHKYIKAVTQRKRQFLLPECDYVTFGYLLLQIYLTSVCNVRAPYSAS